MSDMVTTGQTALNGKPHNDDDAEERDVTGGKGNCRVLRSLLLAVARWYVDVYILYIERNT